MQVYEGAPGAAAPRQDPLPPAGFRAADRQSAGGGARIPAGRGRKGPEIGQRPPGSRLPAPDRLYCVARRRARPRLVPRGRRRRPAIGARARRRSTGNQTGARPEAEPETEPSTWSEEEPSTAPGHLVDVRPPGRRRPPRRRGPAGARGAWSELADGAGHPIGPSPPPAPSSSPTIPGRLVAEAPLKSTDVFRRYPLTGSPVRRTVTRDRDTHHRKDKP